MCDLLKHPIGIAKDIVIPKPKNPVAFRLQECCALRIRLGQARMLSAIKLHNKPFIKATEVYDVSADLMLPPELRTMQLAVTESPPERLFGVGLIPTETTHTVLEPSFQTFHPFVPCSILSLYSPAFTFPPLPSWERVRVRVLPVAVL
jgi:hypothetical protein